MRSKAEINRIATAYEGYAARGCEQRRWTLENPGNLAIVQERSERLKAMLNRAGMLPLTEYRILEIGCGYGRILSSFKEWGAEEKNLVGVDLLPDRVAEARQRNPNITYLAANGEALSLKDGSFDIVVLFTVLSSVLSLEMRRQMVAEVRRVLAPHGIVIWYDMIRNNPWNPNIEGIPLKAVKKLFDGFECCLERITLLPPLARKLGRGTRLGYKILRRIPWLKTHSVGCLARRD